MRYIKQISEGVNAAVNDGIYPNTIKINPIDVGILKQEIGEPNSMLLTVLGLRIEESEDVEIGRAFVYSDNKLESFLK